MEIFVHTSFAREHFYGYTYHMKLYINQIICFYLWFPFQPHKIPEIYTTETCQETKYEKPERLPTNVWYVIQVLEHFTMFLSWNTTLAALQGVDSSRCKQLIKLGKFPPSTEIFQHLPSPYMHTHSLHDICHLFWHSCQASCEGS